VNATVVGYVTGGILLSLGLVLMFLNYRSRIDMVLFREFWRVLGIYLGYIIVLAAGVIVMRFTTKIPDYIFRKILHIIAFTSILPLLFCTDVWWIAALVEFVFVILVILALIPAERLSFYRHLLVEKEKHEVVISFAMLFSLMTLLLVVFWGVFGPEHKYIILASIMAWGPGDAAAAIVGRNWGRHKLSGKHIEGVKSVEGTVAMGMTSFVCTFVTLVTMSGLSLGMNLLLSLVIAPIAALVELFSKKGSDTVTVPIASSLILLAGMFLFHI